jgi:glyoxylase-like metal-dependent hydrolase (beta-lactamase superfamily II)
MLPSMFHRDRTQAQASLDQLMALQPDVVLPGHGPALRLKGSDVADRRA